MSEFMKFVLEDEGKAAEDAGYVAYLKNSQLDDLKDF